MCSKSINISKILKQKSVKVKVKKRLNDFPTAIDKQAEPARNFTKVDTKIPITVTSSQSSTPESPGTPTQVTLAKAPTPWMQNKSKPQEELPEWAKRTNVIKPASDPSEDVLSPVYVQVQSFPQPAPPARTKQEQRQYSSPQSVQQTRPQQLSQQPQQQRWNADSVASQQTNSHNERVVPMRVSWSKLISYVCPFSKICSSFYRLFY